MKKLLSGLIIGLLSQISIAAAAENTLMFGINEGTAGQEGYAHIQAKYQLLADYLSKPLKKTIKVESSQNLNSSSENLKKARYDLFFSKPSNVAAKAMRDQNYDLVASAKGAFTVDFIVNKDSPLKKPADALGKRFVFAQGTFMEKAGLATLRELKLAPAPEQTQYTKFQEAIAFMVEKKFADVGVVAPLVAKDWEKKGGRILFESKKLPFWSLIASPNMPPEDVAKVRETLINMENSEEGKKVLEKIGVKGFVAGNKQEYLDLLTWLGN